MHFCVESACALGAGISVARLFMKKPRRSFMLLCIRGLGVSQGLEENSLASRVHLRLENHCRTDIVAGIFEDFSGEITPYDVIAAL